MNSNDKITIKCICNLNDIHSNKKELKSCLNCYKFQHKDCIKFLIKMEKYICPYCQMKYFDPCIKVIENLLSPSLIQYQPLKTNKVEYSLNMDIDKLKASKEFNLYTSFIIIHCLQVNEEGFTYKWPLNSIIKVNNKVLQEIPEDATKKHLELQPVVFTFCANIEKKANEFGYKYFPYNQPIHRVNENLVKLKETQIEISILERTKNLSPMDYIVSVDFVKVMDGSEVANSIHLLRNKSKIQTMVKKNDDMLFDTSKEEVSLLDIYTGEKRIELPCRGLGCHHLSVFDLTSFVVLNRKKRKYKCPICGKNTRLIYVDWFILNLIKLHPMDTKLLIDSEYCVYPLERNNSNKSHSSYNSVNRLNKKEMIDDHFQSINQGIKDDIEMDNYDRDNEFDNDDDSKYNSNMIFKNKNEEIDKEKECKMEQEEKQSIINQTEIFKCKNDYNDIKKDIITPIYSNTGVNSYSNNYQTNDNNTFIVPKLSLSKALIDKNKGRMNDRLSEYIKVDQFDNYTELKYILADCYYKYK